MSIPHVLPSHETRDELPKALRRFRDQGVTAEPLFSVLIGAPKQW